MDKKSLLVKKGFGCELELRRKKRKETIVRLKERERERERDRALISSAKRMLAFVRRSLN